MDDYSVKIIDWGTAKHVNELLDTHHIGTYLWMAPEMLMPKLPLDRPSYPVDIYSYSIILWEIFCGNGTLPYAGTFDMSKLLCAVKFQQTRPTIPSECNQVISRLMQRCWHEEPQKRPSWDNILCVLECVDMPDWTASGVADWVRNIEPDEEIVGRFASAGIEGHKLAAITSMDDRLLKQELQLPSGFRFKLVNALRHGRCEAPLEGNEGVHSAASLRTDKWDRSWQVSAVEQELDEAQMKGTQPEIFRDGLYASVTIFSLAECY